MIIFGWDLAKVNWYLVAYVLASIVGLVYGTQKVYATGQARGVIFGIGALLVVLYFGLRWFGSKIQKPKSWPPIINMCPDYLTYVSSLPGCVDMLGVTTASAGLQKTLPSEVNSLQSSNSTKVFEFTSENVKDAKVASDLQRICDRCQSAGVTWEGVYDGSVCVGISKTEKDRADAEQCLLSV
jgi:hypothetical protein